MPKRKRQFRNSVVMTFAAAAGCAQVTHDGGSPNQVDGQRPVIAPVPETAKTVTSPIVSINPPRPPPIGGGAGVAGWIETIAGGASPTNPPHENCPAMLPTRGTPCLVGMICDYGTPMSCSPTPAYRASCSSGTWEVAPNNPSCNPPPPPVTPPPPGEDAGA
ncbi:MAG TPA: hypothetical protein VJV78_34475 [Polyangiales bacterium]|nr:hypothetical protein [Polyangiales bacterium]